MSRDEREPETVRQLQQDAADAAEFISGYVVQATTNDRGNLGEQSDCWAAVVGCCWHSVWGWLCGQQVSLVRQELSPIMCAEMTVPPISHGTEAEPVLPGMRIPRARKEKKPAA